MFNTDRRSFTKAAALLGMGAAGGVTANAHAAGKDGGARTGGKVEIS